MIRRFLFLFPALYMLLRACAQPLVDFQVAQPPPLPQNAQQCTIQILERTFGNSFGDPEIVQFTPPTDCGPVGSWAGISLNFTVTSNGTQFDRLGIFTFQNVEIWRTSTPEPTPGDGIIWTYIKDVTRYIPLFSQPGTFILQLDNLLETGLDGQYVAMLQATFFASSTEHPSAPKANTIIPVTTLANNTGNEASVPPGFSLNVTVPRNAVQIFAELYASGNGQEEFWYLNTADEFVNSLPAGFAFPDGPFREVRMLVDGQLAGVAFPYAVIFTGGIMPPCWSPITSYGALDLPTYFIDLTPIIPVLTDGNAHNITIDVASAEADHAINQNWFVSGNLQVITDPSSSPTTGNITVYNAQPFAVSNTNGSVAPDGDIIITVNASRSIYIEADIVSGSGVYTHVVWSQEMEFSNTQFYLDDLNVQNVVQTANGTFLSMHNSIAVLQDNFSYPLAINITSVNATNITIMADFDHSYDRTSLPSPFILGSSIHNHQTASGIFVETILGNFGNGTNNNTFSYIDNLGNTFNRQVNAAFENITLDNESGTLAPVSQPRFPFFKLSPPALPKARLPGGR